MRELYQLLEVWKNENNAGCLVSQRAPPFDKFWLPKSITPPRPRLNRSIRIMLSYERKRNHLYNSRDWEDGFLLSFLISAILETHDRLQFRLS